MTINTGRGLVYGGLIVLAFVYGRTCGKLESDFWYTSHWVQWTEPKAMIAHADVILHENAVLEGIDFVDSCFAPIPGAEHTRFIDNRLLGTDYMGNRCSQVEQMAWNSDQQDVTCRYEVKLAPGSYEWPNVESVIKKYCPDSKHSAGEIKGPNAVTRGRGFDITGGHQYILGGHLQGLTGARISAPTLLRE